MKQLTKFQSVVFLVGGVLMVAGAGCFAFMWLQEVMCWLFLLGATLFAIMQMMQTYEGKELTIRRLKSIQCLADILFVLAGILMVDHVHQFLLPLFNDAKGAGYITCLTYVYNKWVVVLLIAAILEVYTTHRLASELNKIKNT